MLRPSGGTISATIDGLAPGAYSIDVTGPAQCHHSRPSAATFSSGKPQIRKPTTITQTR